MNKNPPVFIVKLCYTWLYFLYSDMFLYCHPAVQFLPECWNADANKPDPTYRVPQPSPCWVQPAVY